MNVDAVPKEVDTIDKIGKAVRLVRALHESHNMVLAYSSGKDSVVLDYICTEAGIKIRKVHNVTTIDPPGTISFAVKAGCELNRNDLSFLDLVEKKGFPTMFRRFCCTELKEKYISDYLLCGIRKDESVKRAKCYSDFEDIYYYTKKKFTCRYFPLLNFTDCDIEWIVNEVGLKMHPDYYRADGSFDVKRRLGCIGCPLQGDRGKIDFLRYPRLLRQILKRGILFHQRQGRSAYDAALNLVYNLFYSNHRYEQYQQAFQGLFDTDPWEILDSYFFIDREEIMKSLPKPKF